jgi:hypothetical protein
MKTAFSVEGTDGRVIGFATGCDYVTKEHLQSDEPVIRQGDIGSLDAPDWLPAGSVNELRYGSFKSAQQGCVGRQ